MKCKDKTTREETEVPKNGLQKNASLYLPNSIAIHSLWGFFSMISIVIKTDQYARANVNMKSANFTEKVNNILWYSTILCFESRACHVFKIGPANQH